MSWAGRRRFFIALIVGAVIVAFLAIILIATFYETPTCTDGIQNQDETGVDCGGSCAYLCTADLQPPTVLFPRSLTNEVGRTDFVALVENKNLTAAAKNVSYTVTLYDKEGVLLKKAGGVFDLPPHTVVPVFIPGIVSGARPVGNEFLEIVTSSLHWFDISSDPRVVPLVSNTKLGGSTDAPRIEAVLTNPTVTTLTNVKVLVIVRDVQKEVIGVSQTIVPFIGAQSVATALFTWNGAFAGTPTTIEVVPVIPLP